MSKSKKEPVQGSLDLLLGADAATVPAETKPKVKVRKKQENAEAEAKPVSAKSVKAKAVVSEEPVIVEAAPAAAENKDESATPAKKRAAKKTAAKKAAAPKTKGRDLVVDEPGAVEVAEVLHREVPTGDALPAAGADEDDDKADEDRSDQWSESARIVDSGASKREKRPAPAAVPEKAPEPKLERLQKILARAGISSRRKAEELITGGHVQINGQVVTELGSKADPARDHVRVDGKLLQGPERIRYFMLNKPKGYVTTVSDPEGRPTVMQFFERENERLYPVGRLDYLSEGLLLVTNDGDLANKLTKASSGVEKTYLVKVAGQPTEEMLDALREGVVIERGRPGTGSGRVRTAPAQIRQVRQGDNPWYEVILIEGRNRELRKMFEEIGHHVEKIRRIGYGPLILDLEPGKLRELEADEVQKLRLTADGKLKTRRRRGPAVAQLPREAGKTVRFKKADGKPGYEKPSAARSSFARPGFTKPGFARPDAAKPRFEKPEYPAAGPAKPRVEKPSFEGSRDARPDADRAKFDKPPYGKPAFSKPGFSKQASFSKSGPSRTGFGGGSKGRSRPDEPPVTDYVVPRRPDLTFGETDFDGKGAFNPDFKPGFRTGGKPGFSASGPQKRFGADSRSDSRSGPRPPFKPAGARSGFGEGSRAEAGRDKPFRPAPPSEDVASGEPRKPIRIGIEPVEDRPRSGRTDRPAGGGKSFGKPFQGRGEGFQGGAKPFRPTTDRPGGGRPSAGRPGAGPTGDRPFRPREDRPFTGSKPFRPRADGPRADGPRAGSAPSGDRPFRPRADGPSGGGRPQRFAPRTDGPPARRAKSFDGGDAAGAPREFRPREGKSFGGPKKFGAAKRFGATSYGTKNFDKPKPQPGGSNSKPSGKLGPDGQPRVKVRARDSFTGKNKGRPKPKPKKDE